MKMINIEKRILKFKNYILEYLRMTKNQKIERKLNKVNVEIPYN